MRAAILVDCCKIDPARRSSRECGMLVSYSWDDTSGFEPQWAYNRYSRAARGQTPLGLMLELPSSSRVRIAIDALWVPVVLVAELRGPHPT